MKLPPWWPWAAAGVGAALLFGRRGYAATGIGGKMGRLTAAQVDARFGPLPYTEGKGGRVNVSPDWIARRIIPVKLFDGKVVKLHRAVAGSFRAAYEAAVRASGYHPQSVQTFVPRHILWKTDKPLSMHSYGIAVDFDPNVNPWGTTLGRIDQEPAFVKAFEDAGWVWGGRWKPNSRDSMHFEFTRA